MDCAYMRLPFEIDWIKNSNINERSIHSYCEFIKLETKNINDTNDRKKLLILALRCIDLTTLAGDDCKANVEQLRLTALYPLSEKILAKLLKNQIVTEDELPITTASICTYPIHLSYLNSTDQEEMYGNHVHNVKLAVVSTGFPSGQLGNSQVKEAEILYSKDLGAHEIDVVINRSMVLMGEWKKLYEDICVMRKACGHSIKLKVIIEVGELETLSNVFKASMVAMNAGADFIKTSTGKASVNATLQFGTVMMRAIWLFHKHTGRKVGFKAAGGIKTSEDAILWLNLVQHILGIEWLNPRLFRIGASSLLADVQLKLEKEIE